MSETGDVSGSAMTFMRDTTDVIREQTLGAATSLVDYQSAGNCLVVGRTEQSLSLVDQLKPLSITVLDIDHDASRPVTRPVKRLTDEGIAVYLAPKPTVSGYLGSFQIEWLEQTDSSAGRTHNLAVMQLLESGFFDLILDLSTEPLIDVELPPLGYFYAPDQVALDLAIQNLPDLVGEFEKPRYFHYDATICAHSRSELIACSRCLDACATTAIEVAGEGITVNPYLCQGCGSCATTCPTGAISYAYPRTSDAISRTRDLLVELRGELVERVGEGNAENTEAELPVLLLHKNTDDEQALAALTALLPRWILPLAVEEVSAYGMDYWASMLAAGFRAVLVLVETDTHLGKTSGGGSMQSLLAQQAEQLAAIVHPLDILGLGWSDEHPEPVQVLNRAMLDELLSHRSGADVSNELPSWAGPHFGTHNDKRQTFRMAVDQLCQGFPAPSAWVELSQQSPFGRIKVNSEGCTLCMACVSVCPAGALLDGQDSPKLRFIESNCVQCGLCEQACPEQVITRVPGYTFDSVEARNTEVLHEDEPFNCVRCNKAFATKKMIGNMTGKLSEHWMFGDPAALRRLKMCGDCRVIDMFEHERGGIDVHRKT